MHLSVIHCLILDINCIILSQLRSVQCPAGHGYAGPFGGRSQCGSPDPQYPSAGGSISLGRQLFLPEDPEKQSQ